MSIRTRGYCIRKILKTKYNHDPFIRNNNEEIVKRALELIDRHKEKHPGMCYTFENVIGKAIKDIEKIRI